MRQGSRAEKTKHINTYFTSDNLHVHFTVSTVTLSSVQRHIVLVTCPSRGSAGSDSERL